MRAVEWLVPCPTDWRAAAVHNCTALAFTDDKSATAGSWEWGGAIITTSVTASADAPRNDEYSIEPA